MHRIQNQSWALKWCGRSLIGHLKHPQKRFRRFSELSVRNTSLFVLLMTSWGPDLYSPLKMPCSCYGFSMELYLPFNRKKHYFILHGRITHLCPNDFDHISSEYHHFSCELILLLLYHLFFRPIFRRLCPTRLRTISIKWLHALTSF